ncbi:FecCD family ABC transporter permease [Paenibacillus woosongensis]|uniref:Iron chelate uptake ABC transporter family permease subunit n=1 Tax=Paenibacillus woosongensis TaxID=307580 RepID=A0A7X2Z2S2_9BACL|nr:iron ABC transporter permease [Paenibacillus woosongensis]MUG45806.1 iron chelate uptake ABC transporter family permease subunit [Paenibacillus woosongensis]
MRARHCTAVLILGSSPFLIVFTIVISVIYGAKNIDISTIREALFHFDAGNVNHQIIIHSRLPRAVGALLIGAFLAISGALMQGMTRNYLASPSIMGVSDGSAFAITLCMVFMPDSNSAEMILYSFMGSALSIVIVFGLASLLPGGLSPVHMAILGTIIGTFLSSLSAAMAAYFQISQNISFWYNARLHQLNPELIKLAIPFAVIGIVLAIWLSKSITVLSLGEEIALSLGQKTKLIKFAAMLTVVILTGISVALAGKIGFVGLIVPHIVRFLTGVNYKWIIPCSGIVGALFLALCDVLSRFLNYPYEMPIGVVTSLLGVPFFLYLIRSRGDGKRA